MPLGMRLIILISVLFFSPIFTPLIGHAENAIVFPLPAVQFNAAEFKLKNLESKRAELRQLLIQFTKDYNQQFKAENQITTSEVISAEIMNANIKQITELPEKELDQPIDVHIENIKTTYDYVAQQFYNYERATQSNSSQNSAPDFRNLEIVFALLIVALAAIAYFKTYKRLRLTETAKNGFSIIEVMVAIGLLGIVGVGVSSMLFNMMNSNNYAQLGNSALNMKAELTEILSNDRAWANTIADTTLNPDATAAFACLRTSTACAAGTYPFTPKLVNNTLFRTSYNPQTSATQGFNVNGVVCSTFSTGSPDDSCPMRYTFTWTPMCPSTGACINPQIRIRLIFNFSSTSKLTKLSPERYGNDNIIIGNKESMYSEAACNIMSGSWDPVTQVCTPANVNITCTSSSYSSAPVATCGTLSGGSTPTCGAYDGVNCTCSIFVTVYTANGQCTCPPSHPTIIANTRTPASPVNPASYSVLTTCQ